MLTITSTSYIVIERGECYRHVYIVVSFSLLTSFLSLLTKAEEELNCEYVFIVFSKSSSLLECAGRIYRFFGFTLLSPNAPLVPLHCCDLYLFMAYKLDD